MSRESGMEGRGEMIGGPTGKQWRALDMKRAHKKKNERLTATGFAIFWRVVGGRIGGEGSGHGMGGGGGGVVVRVTLEGGKG